MKKGLSRGVWWLLVGSLLLLVSWVSRYPAIRLWPYALAARGALIGAALYVALALVRKGTFSFRSCWGVSGLIALVGTFWCCVPLTNPEPTDLLRAGLLALVTALVASLCTTLAVWATARASTRG